jgi:hypothetical protein
MITSVIGAGVLQATEYVGKTSIGENGWTQRSTQAGVSTDRLQIVQPVDPTDRAGNGPLREEDGMAGHGDFDLRRLKHMERRLQSLEDAEAIRNLKSRYAALCDDSYDADGIAALMHQRSRRRSRRSSGR